MFEPPPSSAHGHALFAAAAHQRPQLVDRVGLGEILGRSAQVKPRVRRERLSPLDDMFEALVQAHARFSDVSGAHGDDHVARAERLSQMIVISSAADASCRASAASLGDARRQVRGRDFAGRFARFRERERFRSR